MPTRAARYAMTGFSAAAVAFGVTVIIYAVSVLASSAELAPSAQAQPTGPIRTGVVNTPPVVPPAAQASLPAGSTPVAPQGAPSDDVAGSQDNDR